MGTGRGVQVRDSSSDWFIPWWFLWRGPCHCWAGRASSCWRWAPAKSQRGTWSACSFRRRSVIKGNQRKISRTSENDWEDVCKPNRKKEMNSSGLLLLHTRSNLDEMRFYLNANESKGALIVDELSSKVGEIAADSLAADLIAFELEHRPIWNVKNKSKQKNCGSIHIIIIRYSQSNNTATKKFISLPNRSSWVD